MTTEGLADSCTIHGTDRDAAIAWSAKLPHVRHLDLDLSEDAVLGAFLRGGATWPVDGVPNCQPPG